VRQPRRRPAKRGKFTIHVPRRIRAAAAHHAVPNGEELLMQRLKSLEVRLAEGAEDDPQRLELLVSGGGLLSPSPPHLEHA
jgi:DNA polymerase III psi subunit